MAIQWRQLWEDLNERQRHSLRVLYRRESDLAVYYNSHKAMFAPKKKGAEDEYRRLCRRAGVTPEGLKPEGLGPEAAAVGNEGV